MPNTKKEPSPPCKIPEKKIINSAKTKSTIGLKRKNNLEKFYTVEDCVQKCISRIKKHVRISKTKDIVLEPSAGSGAFVSGLKKLCKNSIFLDIEPEGPLYDGGIIRKQDFLQYDVENDFASTFSNTWGCGKIHTIGNPPFGRQSSLARKFIKKASAFSSTISFILPRSFKKESLQSCFPRNFHLVCCEDIEKDSFIIDGEIHNVPCVFQIWERRDHDRNVDIPPTPISFDFVKKNSLPPPDIAFRRVGVNCGKVSNDIDAASAQSNYFIRLHKGLCEPFKGNLLETLNKVTYAGKEFTVGPRSISKSECIKGINSVTSNIKNLMKETDGDKQ